VELIHPHAKTDMAGVLRDASAAGTRLLIVGGRHHMDKGNPCEVDAEVWTTMLDGVIAYDPAELLITVAGGMRCGDLARVLADHGQEWPVDAPCDATVGGVIASGTSSTRRLRVGHVRESVVAMELLTGDGRSVRSGAKTVKNSTGYDLRRLFAGSLGTLGVIVEVTLKVQPMPETRMTLLVMGGGIELGHRLFREVPGAAEIRCTPSTVCLRLEGWAQEVAEAETAARKVATLANVSDEDVPPLPENRTVLEVAVAPSLLEEALEGTENWAALAGVGIAWVGADEERDVRWTRSRVAGLGGIAPAVRGPGGLGPRPDDAAAAGVSRRIAQALDPASILAPGRGWQG
jgi:glycolate oxidase FAD binding subunit